MGRSLTFHFDHQHSQADDEDNSFTLTSETNMATISNLSPGKIYAFQVQARTAVGYGPYSGRMYFQTLKGGKCCHFVLRSACNHRSLVCVLECFSLSSGGLLPDTPAQLLFLFIIICICRFAHLEKFMQSECIVYTIAVFLSPVPCCLCASDKQ